MTISREILDGSPDHGPGSCAPGNPSQPFMAGSSAGATLANSGGAGPRTYAELVAACVHYWILRPPNGARVVGVCRVCRAERDFPTSYTPGGSRKDKAGEIRLPVAAPAAPAVPDVSHKRKGPRRKSGRPVFYSLRQGKMVRR